MVGGDWGDMRWFLSSSPRGETKKMACVSSDVGLTTTLFWSTTCLFGGGSALPSEGKKQVDYLGLVDLM